MITPTTTRPLTAPTVDGEPLTDELDDLLLESTETQDLPQAVLSLLQQVVLPDLVKLTLSNRFATAADWVKPTAIRPPAGDSGRGENLPSFIFQEKPRSFAQGGPLGVFRDRSVHAPVASLFTRSDASGLRAPAPADISTRSVVEAKLTQAGVPLAVSPQAPDQVPHEVGDRPVEPAATPPSRSPAVVAAPMDAPGAMHKSVAPSPGEILVTAELPVANPPNRSSAVAAVPMEASSPMHKPMVQHPGETLVMAEQPYLRLPFAKNSVVGHVNVSKPSDTSIQLQLAGSSSDITRHLALHLDSAEPNWRLTEDQPSGQQRERNGRQHSDDDADDSDSYPGTPKWQG